MPLVRIDLPQSISMEERACRVLPEPGGEQDWIEELPADLRDELAARGRGDQNPIASQGSSDTTTRRYHDRVIERIY